MKLIHINIVMVEEGDTTSQVVHWINSHSSIDQRDLQPQNWTNFLYPGDLIIFNSLHAMYRLNGELPLGKGGDETSDEPTTPTLETKEQFHQFIKDRAKDIYQGGRVEIDNS